MKDEIEFAFVEPDWRDKLYGFIFVHLVMNNPLAGERCWDIAMKIQEFLFASRCEKEI